MAEPSTVGEVLVVVERFQDSVTSLTACGPFGTQAEANDAVGVGDEHFAAR